MSEDTPDQDTPDHPEPIPPRHDVPRWAMADVWVALGFDAAGFEAMYVRDGDETLWGWLLRTIRERPPTRATSGDVGQVGPKNGDPLHLRALAALDSLDLVTSVNVEVVPSVEVLSGYGGRARREPLEATVTVIGQVRS